jgi:drug/metabolite transporter (DMT)-like permease
MNSHRFFGPHLRLVGMALLWGASWPAGRVVAQNMPPLAAASLRFLLAAAVLLPWLYWAGGMAGLRQWSARRWLGMAAAGATGVFGYAAFFLMGLQHVPAGKAALVITLNPVLTLALAFLAFGATALAYAWYFDGVKALGAGAASGYITLVLAVWLFRERLNRTIIVGMALAACGAVVVISHGQPLALLEGSVGLGELLILGCVACWVTYTLIGRWLLTGVDALSTTAVTSTMGAAMLLAASLVVEGPAGLQAAVHGSGPAWGALAFLAFGATALAYAWYFDGVKALGAGAASGYITLVPVIGVALSALWLGESIAVAGTALMNWGRRPAPAPRMQGAQAAARS